MRNGVARSSKRTWIQLVAAAAGALASLAVQARTIEPRAPLVISALHGEVQVTSAGKPFKPTVGATVKLPAMVRTGTDGSIELRQGETIVSAAPGAQLEIPLSADPAETLDRIIQSSGNVYYSIAKRTSSKLRVETRYLVAVIKGTQFNVAVTGTSSTLSLLEGLIELRSADGTDVTEIAAGQVGTLSADQPRIRVLSLTSGENVRSGMPPAAARVTDGAGASSGGAGASVNTAATIASSSPVVNTNGSTGTADVKGMSAASSGGSMASGSVMASNVSSGNDVGAANAAAASTMGALQSLTARTTSGGASNSNAGNAGAGSANAANSNAGNAGAGSANAANSNAGNAGAGSANAANSNAANAGAGSANAANSNAANAGAGSANAANSNAGNAGAGSANAANSNAANAGAGLAPTQPTRMPQMPLRAVPMGPAMATANPAQK